MRETLVQLAWLVEKGHVIEFYNDVLSAPLEYPIFRFLPGEKSAGAQQQHGAAAGRRGGESAAAAAPAPATAADQPAAAAEEKAVPPPPEAEQKSEPVAEVPVAPQEADASQAASV